MKILPKLFLALSFASNITYASEDKVELPPNFLLFYGNVSHVVMHGSGCFEQLLEHEKREQLTEFWWGYIQKECNSYFSSAASIAAKAKVESEKYLQTVLSYCAKSVIYDNWDKINKSIVKDPDKQCK